MVTTHVADLCLPDFLPDEAKVSHLTPDLQSLPLLSMGQFADSGCGIFFDKDKVKISYKDQVILQGERDMTTRLWLVELTCPPSPADDIAHQANRFDNTSLVLGRVVIGDEE